MLSFYININFNEQSTLQDRHGSSDNGNEHVAYVSRSSKSGHSWI